MGAILRPLLPRKFEYVLFKADSLEPPADPDFTVEQIGPGQEPTPEQRAFFVKCVGPIGFWYQMRWVRRGEGWAWITRNDGQPSSTMFATPAERLRKIFPVITGEKAMNIGPGYTVPEFRGRGLYTKMVQYAANVAKEHGWGPFYGLTSLGNAAAIRGQEKCGLKRVGVWAGTRVLFNLIVMTRRVSD
jgi:GNAT superfamily N-acetyltransferase